VSLRVDSEPEDVHGDERPGEHACKSMDVLDGEARPPVEALLAGEGETERDRRGHEQVGDDSGRAGGVPVDRKRAEDHAATGALTDRRHT
jgi:hypothetical protein